MSTINERQSEDMRIRFQIFSVIFLLFSVPLSGCIDASEDEEITPQGETLIEIQNPPVPTGIQTQVMISITTMWSVFRLSVPTSDAGTKISLSPIMVGMSGGRFPTTKSI